MSERTVWVRLKAVTSEYQAKLAEAGVATKALETKVAGFHTQMRQADLSAKGMLGTLSNLSAGELAAGAAAAVAGAAILKMTSDGIKHYVALATEVRSFMRVSGASAEQSSIMVARAHALGISTETLGTAMFRLSQNVDRNRAELEAHGVEIARNRDGSVNLVDTLDSLGEAWKREGAGQQANVITQAALSRGAIRLLPLLAATKERLQGIDEVARSTHQVLGDKDLKNVLDYKIATHELHAEMEQFGLELAQNVLPYLSQLVTEAGEVLGVIDRAVNTKIPHVGGSPKTVGGALATGEKFVLAGLGINLFGKHNKDAKDAIELEEKLNAQIEANNQVVQEYGNTLDNLFSSTFDVSSATDKFETDLAGAYTALQEAKDAGDKFASSLATSSTTGLQNRAMLQGLEQDLAAAAKKYKELHPDATDAEIRKALSGQINQLKILLGYFSGDKAEAQRLLDVLNQIAGTDLSKPGKTYNLGWGGRVHNPFGGNGVTPDTPAPPIDTTTNEPVDPSGYLQALFDQRMEQIKNRFHAGQATLAEYQRSLDEQLAREKPWTDKWVELQQEKADAVHYWADATLHYLEALAAKQQSIEDNMYKVGDLSTDQYDLILHRRLASLEKYSDAWTQTWEQIQQIEGDALDAQLKLIEAFDAGLQFQKALDASRQQYQYMTSGSSGGSSTVIYSGATWNPTFNAYGPDAQTALDTNSQKLRDYAASLG